MIGKSNYVPAQKGTTLLEVLISMVIVSVGLLGVASMQINTLRNNQSSYERSMSVMFTYSIAERISANKANELDYNINQNLNVGCNIPTGATLADTDRALWLNELQLFLGNDSCGAIQCNGSGSCDVTIRWNDSSRFSDGSLKTLVTKVSL